jgi:hypothetical protein
MTYLRGFPLRPGNDWSVTVPTARLTLAEPAGIALPQMRSKEDAALVW